MFTYESLYEGNDLQVTTFPIRVFSLLGVETLIGIPSTVTLMQANPLQVTNAVGGLNAAYNVGDVVVMNDVSTSVQKPAKVLIIKAHKFCWPDRHESITRPEFRQLWSKIPRTIRCL